MDLNTAQKYWDALNHLHQTDRKAYEQLVQEHIGKMPHKTKKIKPRFGFCILTDAEKVSIKTQLNEYREKYCNYYIYIYYTHKMKAPILPEGFLEKMEKMENFEQTEQMEKTDLEKQINEDSIFISLCKIKGESSQNLYAEAVVHSITFKIMSISICFKKKIIKKILDSINKQENILSTGIQINRQKFHICQLKETPKTLHQLNSHCIDHDLIDKEDVDEKPEEKGTTHRTQKEENRKNKNGIKKDDENELKLYNSSTNILKDITSVKTVKKQNKQETKLYIPKQVQSYSYKVFDRFLHMLLTFKQVTYDDLEILKSGNNVTIYVSNKSDEAMSLNFKEKLSDNVKAYFNEKLLKLTISIELL